MSKRSALFQGGEERYGGAAPEEMSDRPLQATAAQLAKRKIAQAKGTRRPRSESPMPTGGSIFDQATQNGFLSNNNGGHNSGSMPPSNPFAATTGFSFGNNANGSSQSFGSGGGSFTFGAGNQTQQTTPNPGTSFNFGNAASSSSFTFGGSPAPQTNGFGGSSNTGLFGQQNGTGFGVSTPKATTPVIFEDNPSTQTAGGLFGSVSSATANGAQGFSFNNNSSINSTTNLFGAKAAEPAQSTPTSFSGFGSQAAPPQADKPAADGWTSFLGTSKPADAPEPTTNGFKPATTSLFSGATLNKPSASANAPAAPSIFAGFGNTSKSTSNGFNFTAPPADVDSSMMSPENTPQKPNGIGAQAAEPQKSKSLFDRITTDTTQPAASLFASTPAPAVQTPNLFAPAKPAEPVVTQERDAAPSVISTKTPIKSSMENTKPQQYSTFRTLNESLVQFIKTQDLNKDLSSIFQYYLAEAVKLNDTSSALHKAAQLQPTAEKPAEPLYPKLADNASKTAMLFQATLDQPAADTSSKSSLFSGKSSTFTPSTTSLFAPKAVEPEPKTSTSAFQTPSTAPPTTSLFAPKTAAPAVPSLFAPRTTTSTTKANGFQPSAVAATGNALSAFGAAAAKHEDEQKKRRRDEDFDSDEDDAAEWEKRDAEEQAAKRKKLEDAAKSSSGFTLKPTSDSTTTNNVFSSFAKSTKLPQDAAPTDHTWKQGTPIKFGGDVSGSAGALSNAAAPAPKFNLFGSAGTSAAPGSNTSIFANTNKAASPTFNFGQSSAPAVTATPSQAAVSTETADDDDAAPPEPQLEDHARLLPEEEKANDVLLRIEDVNSFPKSMKLESRAVEGGATKMTWIDKGKGPIWILQDKASGKTRIVQKIEHSGRTAMNFMLLKGKDLYKVGGKTGKSVTATFIDHMAGDGSKPSQWAISTARKEDAAEIVKILHEQQAKL